MKLKNPKTKMILRVPAPPVVIKPAPEEEDEKKKKKPAAGFAAHLFAGALWATA